jgi:hypothetical protein
MAVYTIRNLSDTNIIVSYTANGVVHTPTIIQGATWNGNSIPNTGAQVVTRR